jgi:drug/metabolite transporter (DMT)-like permease
MADIAEERLAGARQSVLSGTGFALAGAVCFGFNIAFARLSAQEGVNGPLIIAWRVPLMLALAVVMSWWSGAGRSGLRVAKGEWSAVIGMGLASAFVAICYISSVAFIPVTIAAVIFYTFPVLIVLASPFVDGRSLTAPMLAVVALAFIGVVLVLGPAYAALDPIGLGLALGASLSAVVQFFVATRSPRTPVNAKLFWTQLIVLPTAIAVASLTGGLQPPGVLLLAPLAVALTMGGYIAGFVFQLMALVRISASVGGLAFCLEPVMAALTSALVLDERLSLPQYCGGGLVILAIMANVALERRSAA